MQSKQLYLLRHAKAEMPANGQSDDQRPLASRGKQDAKALGAWMAEHDTECSHVHASSSIRTRETYAALMEHLMLSASFDDQLYLASPGELIRFLQHLPDEQESVMLLGHNPGLHQLAIHLLEESALEEVDDLRFSFPTCGCVKLSIPAQAWKDIQPGTAKLEYYWNRHGVMRLAA